MEGVDGTCKEGRNRSSPAAEEPPGILPLFDQMEDVDRTCDEGGKKSSSAAGDEPPGISYFLYNFIHSFLKFKFYMFTSYLVHL